ncbi:MAG: polysaccharide deacetylase family protein [Clostridia bacterium]|nr:polysaccharide deacetylase family protein [Clostridia bacterium]
MRNMKKSTVLLLAALVLCTGLAAVLSACRMGNNGDNVRTFNPDNTDYMIIVTPDPARTPAATPTTEAGINTDSPEVTGAAPTEHNGTEPPKVTDAPATNVPATEIPATSVPTPTAAPTQTPTKRPDQGNIPDNTPVYGSAESARMEPIPGREEEVYCVTLDSSKEYWDCPVSKLGHIFVHNLVAFPELDLAINPKSTWHDWNNTTVEYVRLLENLYAKNYVLIDANYIFDYVWRDGNLIANLKKTVKLPKGKTGIIISCDNVCFPEDEHGTGRIDKIVVYNGHIASYTLMKDGTEEYSYERDVCDITEQFCLKHPDFSFAGARLMLAVSGNAGILGYRTDTRYASKGYDVEKERAEAREVIKYLKEHGFYFGCHSYAHLDLSTLTGDKLKKDFDSWNTQVKPLIGYTPFYVYPFGTWVEYGTEQYSKLISEGFHVMYGTSMNEILCNGTYKHRDVGNIYGERFIYCGKTLIAYANKGVFEKYADPYELYDNEGRYIKLYR